MKPRKRRLSQVLLPDGRPIPTVLVGNKCDQPASGPAANADRMDAFSRDRGFAGWFAASARDNINVEEAARRLVETVLENHRQMPDRAHGGLPRGVGAGRDARDGGGRIHVLEEDVGGGRRRRDCAC